MLVHIWRSLDGFRGQSNLGTWMYRVAVNTCLGWLRHEKRRCRMLEKAGEEQLTALSSTGPSIESSPDDAVRQLYACIARLAPVDRLLISLYLEGGSAANLALPRRNAVG